MSGDTEWPPLRLRPRPSRILAVFVLVTHGAALSTLVTPRLLGLNFRCGRWRLRTLVLPPDALEPDLLRRLWVRLRPWGTADGSDADAPA